MKIFVAVRTKAKKIFVEKIDETHFRVSVVEMPIENKANLAVIKTLAGYFKISKSKIILISGEKAKQKIFEVSF